MGVLSCIMFAYQPSPLPFSSLHSFFFLIVSSFLTHFLKGHTLTHNHNPSSLCIHRARAQPLKAADALAQTRIRYWVRTPERLLFNCKSIRNVTTPLSPSFFLFVQLHLFLFFWILSSTPIFFFVSPPTLRLHTC